MLRSQEFPTKSIFLKSSASFLQKAGGLLLDFAAPYAFYYCLFLLMFFEIWWTYCFLIFFSGSELRLMG